MRTPLVAVLPAAALVGAAPAINNRAPNNGPIRFDITAVEGPADVLDKRQLFPASFTQDRYNTVYMVTLTAVGTLVSTDVVFRIDTTQDDLWKVNECIGAGDLSFCTKYFTPTWTLPNPLGKKRDLSWTHGPAGETGDATITYYVEDWRVGSELS
jgi:hypothetical protein